MKHVFSKYERNNMDGVISKTLANDEALTVSKKDQKTFVRAFDECAPKLYRFCLLRSGSRELSEDLVSQTFLNAWRYVQEGNVIKSYPVFLYKTLRNLLADHWRSKHSRTIFIDKKLEETLGDSGLLKESLENKVDHRRILAAMNFLPEDQQEMLHWRFVDDLSLKEISRLSGKKPNAVCVSLYRSLNKLKDKFNNDYV